MIWRDEFRNSAASATATTRSGMREPVVKTATPAAARKKSAASDQQRDDHDNFNLYMARRIALAVC